VSGSQCTCAGGHGYHDASVHLCDGDEPAKPDRNDPRWPTKCAHCDYVFTPADQWQVFPESLYRAADGTIMTLRSAPAGAMWFADWMPNDWKGPDGHSLMVKTPGGDWGVDMRASNCTRPDDKVHKCWVRHGDPRTANVTVDKNGDTCNAGAGSILCGAYHGFLRGGFLED